MRQQPEKTRRSQPLRETFPRRAAHGPPRSDSHAAAPRPPTPPQAPAERGRGAASAGPSAARLRRRGPRLPRVRRKGVGAPAGGAGSRTLDGWARARRSAEGPRGAACARRPRADSPRRPLGTGGARGTPASRPPWPCRLRAAVGGTRPDARAGGGGGRKEGRWAGGLPAGSRLTANTGGPTGPGGSGGGHSREDAGGAARTRPPCCRRLPPGSPRPSGCPAAEQARALQPSPSPPPPAAPQPIATHARLRRAPAAARCQRAAAPPLRGSAGARGGAGAGPRPGRLGSAGRAAVAGGATEAERRGPLNPARPFPGRTRTPSSQPQEADVRKENRPQNPAQCG